MPPFPAGGRARGAGIGVGHILSGSPAGAHHLTPFAKIENGKVTYPDTKGKARRRAAAAGQAESPTGQIESPTGQIELRFDQGDKEDRGPAMARKKGKPKFTAAKEARRRARLSAGTPPAGRVIPDKRRKPPKHKPKLEDLAESPE